MEYRLWIPFVRSGEVLRLLGTIKTLESGILPSQVMGIEDEYTAFCFDEACAFIVSKLQNKEEPIINFDAGSSGKKVYSKPSDFYKKFD